jgi:hypothetical protein
MKYGLLLIITAIILFTACSDDKIVEPKLYGDGNDYLIYEKILEKMAGEQTILIVLRDSTYHEPFIAQSIKHFLEQIPGLSQETLEDYLAVNSVRIKLKDIPNIRFVFSNVYDNSAARTVSVSISRVGYNKAKTEAVVTMGASYGPLAGSGSLIFLTKAGNEWVIQKSIMTWIS